ncbi:MAG TPA: helical backbone metal receptor [Candidatus Tumulicola sp.]
MHSLWIFALAMGVSMIPAWPSPKISPAITTTHVRVVALDPFVADDMYAVGCGSNLVGVSSFTDDPRAKSLPRVADAMSVDNERIVALRPDVVIGIPSQQRLAGVLSHAGITVMLLPDDSYESIFTNLHVIGNICGHLDEAATLVGSLRRETEQLRAQARKFRRRPSVFVVLGNAPIWTAGADSFIATLIGMAGGLDAASNLPSAYAQYSAEALLRAQPDVIVADPLVRLESALDSAPWNGLLAVRLHRVYTIQPPRMLMEPGPNYNDGIRWLMQRLRPIANGS